MGRSRVRIIGGGYVGLITGIELLKAGYEVQISSSEISPWTTSDVAGALFEPIVGTGPLQKVQEWTTLSAERLFPLCYTPETGVRSIMAYEYFTTKTPDPIWKNSVRNFQRITKSEFPPTCPDVVDGWKFETVVMNPSKLMTWLWSQFFALGGLLKLETISSLQAIRKKELGFDFIVNCTGLGARFLCQDPKVYPVKGQLVLVWAPWIDRVVTMIPPEGGRVSYIIPRGDGTVALGGLMNHHQWDTKVDWQLADDIFAKCQTILPELGSAKIIGHKVGLRPFRKDVRLEMDRGDKDLVPIIHNYGHGASGITVGWGCALETLNLLKTLSPQTTHLPLNSKL